MTFIMCHTFLTNLCPWTISLPSPIHFSYCRRVISWETVHLFQLVLVLIHDFKAIRSSMYHTTFAGCSSFLFWRENFLLSSWKTLNSFMGWVAMTLFSRLLRFRASLKELFLSLLCHWSIVVYPWNF